MPKEPTYTDLTPTWQGVLPILLATAHTKPSQEELLRLARYADETPALIGELIAALRGAIRAANAAAECTTKSEFYETPHFDALLAAQALLTKLEGGAL